MSQSTKEIDIFTLKQRLDDFISKLLDCWWFPRSLSIEIYSIKRVILGYSVEGEYRCINTDTRATIWKGRFVVTVEPESYNIIEFERKEQS